MNTVDYECQTAAELIERDLVGRMAAGDRAALGTLFRGYHASLCRFISRLTLDCDVIEGVIDDTFWTAWQHAAELPEYSRVSTWLWGISYRCSLKAIEGLVDSRTSVVSHTTNSRLQLSDSHEELVRRLDDLPREQRVLIDMVYGAGQGLDEVAVIMGCDVDALKPQLRQARNSLSSVMAVLDDDSFNS